MAQSGIPAFDGKGVRLALEMRVILKNFGARSVMIGAKSGLLDDTLVIWGGEFGRTVFSQGKLTEKNYGRDHHLRCYTIWMDGGGIKPGMVFGETDD